MKYNLFKEVKLVRDIPEKKLKKGDVATVVDYHAANNFEDGYTLEVFNVFGDTMVTVTVAESDIELLQENEIFCSRKLEAA